MTELDPVLVGILDRSMRQMAIHRATACGANEKLLSDLEKMDGLTAYSIVCLIHGEDPEFVSKREKVLHEANSKKKP